MADGVKDEKLWDSLKNPIFRGRFTKNQYRLKVLLGKKEGSGVFVGGGVDTSMHTLKINALLYKTCIKVLWFDMFTSIIYD